jgi:hypothetical protein
LVGHYAYVPSFETNEQISVLAENPGFDFQARTIPEPIAHAKANPGKVNVFAANDLGVEAGVSLGALTGIAKCATSVSSTMSVSSP